MFIRLFLCLVCLCACIPASAQDMGYTTQQVTNEQQLDLPQDENRLYLTIYGDPSDERFTEIQRWFEENKGLSFIKSHMHYATIDVNSSLFAERYANEITETPCVRIVTPEAIEILRIDGKRIPMSAPAFNQGLTTELRHRLSDGDVDNRSLLQRIKNFIGNDQPENKGDKLKKAIDKKLNVPNLPPVANRFISRLIMKLVVLATVIVVGICVFIGVVKALKQPE